MGLPGVPVWRIARDWCGCDPDQSRADGATEDDRIWQSIWTEIQEEVEP